MADLAPSGAKARFRANVEAIRLARTLMAEDRPASAEEQQVLARWSSWGAVAEVFDTTKPAWEGERAELRGLLSDEERSAASRTTINAHYTDPVIASQMWQALRSLGFAGGQVLEPGSGLGTFIGLAPSSAVMTGVELDPVTAQISRALYPHAQIRGESFAETRLPKASFDAAVGNVPFSNVVLHDRVHNPSRQNLHNYFILKSLALTRPGGMVAVLSSHYTMDAQNPAARREMNALADLVGAVRLPNGAHRRAAGTEVLTDLLILRRREPDEPPRDQSWETVIPISLEGKTTRINHYFDDHPEFMLGEVGIDTHQYGTEALTVTADPDQLETNLADALGQLTFTARREGLVMTGAEAVRPAPTQEVARTGSAPARWDGSIVETETGFATVNGPDLEELKVPKSASRELHALLQLRDTATGLLELEAGTAEDTNEIAETRDQLRRAYQKYLGTYGPLNRFSLRRTGRVNDDGQETQARMIPTAIRTLRQDPFGAMVMALENFDDAEQTATPADILSRRVVAPRTDLQGVETPGDAVAVSLDRTGGIDLAVIADMLGTDEADARASLSGLAFTDPITDKLVHAPAYLSGNVRSKLDAAQAAAEKDSAFEANVEALTEVMPEPLGIEDITAKLGAVWISPEIHEQFLRELLRTREVRVENPLPGMWEVRGGRQGLASTSEWGTERRPAPDIAQAIMEQRTLLVHDEAEDAEGRKRQVLNPVETTAAQEKAEQLSERFAEWVWEDPERSRTLVEEYNRRFNSIVLRDYSDAGQYLSLPGVAETFNPRPHQRAAVARMIAEPSAGLFHEVGAGKTAEMIIGVSEMRRMGLISKPVLVVPNHMLEQFAREWLQIYPQARILVASSKDVTADKRREFVARTAVNDYDGVVMTQTAFAKVPLREQTQQAYIRAQVEELRRVLGNADAEDRMSVKRIERKLLALENKIKDHIDSTRDAGVSFEDTGIDYLVVDEMHTYKNLATESNIRDAAIEGSQRASDLDMKLQFLRSQGRGRVATGATATPISNSVTEAYVMQRYLRPDLLEAAGIDSFDAWAATFGQTVTNMEMSPTGTGFRMKTRFARFSNVPEMLKMWSTFADVKTAEDLQLPTPQIVERPDGTRAAQTEAIQPTVELEDYVADLGHRAQLVGAKIVPPEEDNMLKISTDGRKAALDVRLVLPNDPSGPSKVDVAADAIHRVWEQTKDNQYLDPATGRPSPVPGALQLVFSDIGTPNPEKWNAYDELHAQLVTRGMPAESIRFMHEAKTDADKARMFASARAGHIAVLVGSTEKMGVGTNVQNRAVALYHMDCPWRPSDIAQREGRILRQGNQNEQVMITRLVTERSFDSYMWQGVERKAKFIAQLMRGSLDSREVEEIDSASLSAAEAKAISSGNPLLLEQSTLQNEVSRLKRLERAHSRNESMLVHTKDRASRQIEQFQAEITGLEAALPQVVDTSGENFRMTIDGTGFDSRTDAGQALARWAHQAGVQYAPSHLSRDFGVLGTIAGFEVRAASEPRLGDQPAVGLWLEGIPRSQFSLDREAVLSGSVGMIQRIENKLAGTGSLLERAQADLAETEQAYADADDRIGSPFRHTEALAQAQQELARVEAVLGADESTGDGASDTRPERELDVAAVRGHQASMGVHPDASRDPLTSPGDPEPPQAGPGYRAPGL